MTTLVALTGPAGAGKDTVAELISTLHPSVTRYAFARPIKQMLAALGMEEPLDRAEKEAVNPAFGFSYRRAAQTLGTEWGRSLHPDLWLNRAEAQYRQCTAQVFVITDCRFANEVQWVRELGGHVVHVVGRAAKLSAGAATHASEGGVHALPMDYVLDNSTDGLGPLSEQILALPFMRT